MGRRDVVGKLFALPLVASPTMAFAQDLLDPTSLRSSRVTAADTGPDRTRPANWVGPSYARDMSASVTSALLALIRAYGTIADQIGKLQAQQKDLAEKLAAAIRDKEAKLDEYRQGLFCSGCGKTKSEILSRGEQFPHPGQSIIKPTPEQIAAKERELQAVIDRLSKALDETRTKLAELNPNIDTIRSQIFDGMGLWRTATGFERRLIRQEDNFDASDYFRERQTISKQLAASHKEAELARETTALQRVIGDLELWRGTLQQVEKKRAGEIDRTAEQMAANETNSRRQVAQVDTLAKEVASKITAFGYAGYLNIVTVPMNVNVDLSGLRSEASGYTFRMGKYDRAGTGEVLPRVAEFVGRSRNMTLTGASGSPAVSANQELSRAEAALARLRPRLAAAIAEQRRQASADAEPTG